MSKKIGKIYFYRRQSLFTRTINFEALKFEMQKILRVLIFRLAQTKGRNIQSLFGFQTFEKLHSNDKIKDFLIDKFELSHIVSQIVSMGILPAGVSREIFLNFGLAILRARGRILKIISFKSCFFLGCFLLFLNRKVQKNLHKN